MLATSALQLFCLKNPSSELLHVALGCLRYQNFDPYGILDVSSASSSSQIKKAFHKLSLKYHPDKNPEKAAAEQFILIKKAYDALTDPVAKRNYRLYGNPDGPVRVELSVALPSVEKERR